MFDISVFIEQTKSFVFEKCCDPKAGQSLYRISVLATGYGIRVGNHHHVIFTIDNTIVVVVIVMIV